MAYPDFRYSDLERIWKGTVRVDHSLRDENPEGLENGEYRSIKINDTRYPNKDNVQLDNCNGLVDVPNEISLFVRGSKILEQMECTAVKGYQGIESKNLLQRFIRIRRSLVCKGFILEPTTANSNPSIDACLALLKFDNKYSKEISFNQQGIIAFTSGSKTSNITLSDPLRSVTIAFVASNDKPFMARVSLKHETRKIFCDDSGLKVFRDLIEKKRQSEHLQHIKHTAMTKNSALEVLKTRLVKGEITIEEYQKVKEIILDDENNSSNWI